MEQSWWGQQGQPGDGTRALHRAAVAWESHPREGVKGWGQEAGGQEGQMGWLTAFNGGNAAGV